MNSSVIILGVILCVVLTICLKALPHDRLDAFGIRAELCSWVMFIILIYTKEEISHDQFTLATLSLFAIARILSCSSGILGNPCKEEEESI